MNRHRLDVFALGTGIFFIALAVGYLLDGLDAWDMDGAWAAPALLIALGLAGLVSIVGPRDEPEPVVDGSAADPSEPG